MASNQIILHSNRYQESQHLKLYNLC